MAQLTENVDADQWSTGLEKKSVLATVQKHVEVLM